MNSKDFSFLWHSSVCVNRNRKLLESLDDLVGKSVLLSMPISNGSNSHCARSQARIVPVCVPVCEYVYVCV